MAWPSAAERARTAFDLAIVSVLLDAGAGPNWQFRYPVSGEYVGRSEGLALASLVMFRDCEFSMWPSRPLRVDAIDAGRLPRGEAHSRLPGDGRQSAAGRCRARRSAAPARPDRDGGAGDFRPQRHAAPRRAVRSPGRARAEQADRRAGDPVGGAQASRADLAVAADARRHRARRLLEAFIADDGRRDHRPRAAAQAVAMARPIR